MSPGTQRTFIWINLVLAALVVIGVFVQVYLIASYIFGAGTDALDAHKNLGNIVHGVEILAFLAAIPAYWRRWGEIGWSFALASSGRSSSASRTATSGSAASTACSPWWC